MQPATTLQRAIQRTNAQNDDVTHLHLLTHISPTSQMTLGELANEHGEVHIVNTAIDNPTNGVQVPTNIFLQPTTITTLTTTPQQHHLSTPDATTTTTTGDINSRDEPERTPDGVTLQRNCCLLYTSPSPRDSTSS
eukprot:2346954-Prorocentrum_lima.AAC.1